MRAALRLRVSCLQRLIPRRQLLEHLTAVHRCPLLALVRVELHRRLEVRLLVPFLLLVGIGLIKEIAREARPATIPVGS